MNIPPRLTTQRLILRSLIEQDLTAYTAMCADAEVMRFIGAGQTLTRAEAWRSLAMILGHWQLRGYGLWAVEARSTGEFLGRIGLWYPAGWPGLEVGWMLCRSAWGQGFATEGAIAARDYAFNTLGKAQVLHLIQPANQASIRVAERLGATHQQIIELQGQTVLVYATTRPANLDQAASPA
ncbi:MAG: GNAT family N-acetyltransferase [Cyanobacteria bacterium P01_H01_bin.121]